ncbi:MAG: ABC transporter substrate-binding protein [Rubrobacteraceae bacterium]
MQTNGIVGRRISRKRFLAGAGSAVALAGLGACGPQSGGTGGGGPGAGQPVDLTIIDVAGNLQLSEDVIERFAEENADAVRQVNFTTATAPELPAKIQAQQNADQVSLALALTGADGLSAGIEQGIWQEISSEVEANFINPAAQELAQGFGVLIAYGNYGPMFTYNPEMVSSPPSTTDELLAFARQNDGQLMYARPANSGPGRTLIMGLPYILGDPDPRDPETWENTWSYLEELGQYIEYYPAGTSDTMEELGQGSRAMVASTMGWDMNPRVLGIVPKNFEALVLDDTTLIADGHYAAIPKGLDDRLRDVTLDLISYMLSPEQQATTYDQAYFYPGPAVEGATLDMAPQESQDAVESVRRPEFDQLIEELTIETQLGAKPLVRAFEIWDERVGGSKIREEE